jgi:hypothetical protein
MNFLLPIYIWPIFRLLTQAAGDLRRRGHGRGGGAAADQEAINAPFCPLQEKFHTFVLRGLWNISEAP